MTPAVSCCLSLLVTLPRNQYSLKAESPFQRQNIYTSFLPVQGTHKIMRQNMITLALCSLAAFSTAAPVERRSNNNNVSDEFQSIDGFPAPNDQQILSIEQRAHGTLSNSTPPASVDPDTIISLQVIAAQEQFEVAFFQQLLTNITNNEAGFLIRNSNARTLGLNALTAIVAVSATN